MCASSTYSQELAASASGSSAPECEQSPSAKSNRTAAQSCNGTGPPSPATTTSALSPQDDFFRTHTASSPTSSVVASHARTSATLVLALELTANDPGSGLNSRASLARYDRSSSSWRTSQHCLIEGFGTVLGDLARIGYDAEWSVVSACSVGAPHVRRRVFIVAYPDSVYGRPRVWDTAPREFRTLQALDGPEGPRTRWRARLANPSELYGGADGLPFGRERNRAIGNAVAPDVVERIGRAIMRVAA
jgi:hypothetical protein